MKKYIAFIFLALVVASSSCKKDFLSLEVNPNVPSVASPNLLLSGALRQSADIVNGGSNNNYEELACWMGYLSWSTGYQVNNALEQYQFTTSDYQTWTQYYLNISNYNAILQAKAGPYYDAMAKIMIAYNFQALVDNYNNVPYTEALKATANLNPKYDDASAIYDDLMKQLDAAIVLIQGAPTTSTNPGAADIMFKGNMTNWIKFANTLKLKLAIRQSNLAAKQATLKTAVAATQALGYLDGTIQAAVNPGYANVDANGGQQSPIFLSYGKLASGGGQSGYTVYQANSYAVRFFFTRNDSLRARQVYLPDATQNVIFSTEFGQTDPPKFNGSNATPSKLGPGILKDPTMDAVILSSAESLFLQAEGVAEGLITGDPVALYNAGITADFLDKGLKASDAATYYAQPAIAYPSGGSLEDQKKAIIEQKWAALAVYGVFEAFNEYRRTGYPSDIKTSILPGVNAPNQVTRLFYPFVEYSTNAANVAAQGTIDKFKSKIFWAK